MTTTRTSGGNRLPADVHLIGLGLHLREWADTDIHAMVDLFNDPHVDQWTPLRSPFDLAAARTYLDQARTRRTERRSIQLAITTDNHTPLGEIIVYPTNLDGRTPDGHLAELAYAIGPHHRRQGLATRAVRLMTAYAYHQLQLREVILRIDPRNTASMAVARATDFKPAGDDPLTRDDSHPLRIWRHHTVRH